MLLTLLGQYGFVKDANQTALICSGSTLDVVHQCLSDDLSCLLSWVKQSKMQLNIEKFETVLYHIFHPLMLL